MARKNAKSETMTTDGQFVRYYRKFVTAQNHTFANFWCRHNARRLKYWHRVAQKWRDKMRKAAQ
jgi:hypothetical protein